MLKCSVSDPPIVEVIAALVSRIAGIEHEDTEARDLVAWTRSLTSRLSFHQGLAVVEHLFAVRGLLDIFFEPQPAGGVLWEAIERGQMVATLGLFSPNPDFSWSGAAIEGAWSDTGLVLQGEVRVPTSRWPCTVVLAKIEEEGYRLVLLPDDLDGVVFRGSRSGGSVGEGEPCWLACVGAEVRRALVSTAVNLDPDEPYGQFLDAYGSVYALAVSHYASRGARALRRAARTSVHRGVPFSASQIVTMEITEVEVEADLVASSVRESFALDEDDPSRAPGLLLAASAARVATKVAKTTAELIHGAGLECDGPFSAAVDRALVGVYLGGQAMADSELARSIGL